ncbi:MAG: histidine kinase [Dehalococcoidia bacterium]|jgi:PAS domain S-box-containing protein|nr:histidine kinase [Dehalococcoidia bacterium]MDP7084842.1 histidine kinase [Dehalococcoidia bacterium]MDP7199677.1 histidine kinase [Dehalococcoidia bacterium]MDP7511384.1 histidine kinase [Dehalococcoidia bacterium]
MNRPELGAVRAAGNLSSLSPLDWTEKWKHRLYPYRPRLRSRQFWVVQGLVLLVAAVHIIFEILEALDHGHRYVPLFYFLPLSMFFVPMVYTALRFGLPGTLATAAWCSILVLPSLFLAHDNLERTAEFLQVAIVIGVAVLVGHRVDREKQARERAEAVGAALKTSEGKYRGLFESSPVAILVLDQGAIVLEANPVAGDLFGRASSSLRGMAVADLLGIDGAQKLLHPFLKEGRKDANLILESGGGSKVYLEPSLTLTGENEVSPVTQVLLRDVTEERHRQMGLRAYAAHMLRAQEDERKRIAQELHDVTLQELILLCRRLDLAESACGSESTSVSDELREARSSAEQVVEGLRDLTRALRPPVLEDLGLVTSIRRLLVELSGRTATKWRFKVTGEERRQSAEVELGLFRIAQEALHNVERHANANRVAVSVTFTKHEITLDVTDNGIGFIPPPGLASFAATGQLGLLGVQERAELLRGRFEIRSSPGNGTRVTASIPVAEIVIASRQD